MKLFFLVFLFFLASPLYGAPFVLEFLSEEVRTPTSNRTSREIVQWFAVKDRPLMLRLTIAAQDGVEIYAVKIVDSAKTDTALARSLAMIFYKRGKIESVALHSYGKNESLPRETLARPEYKGIGELSLQPVLSLPEIPEIRAALARTNYTRMAEALGDTGRRLTIAELNSVVMQSSHLGKLLAGHGFEVDRAYTAQDKVRHEAYFRFIKEGVRRPSFWRRCWDALPSLRKKNEENR